MYLLNNTVSMSIFCLQVWYADPGIISPCQEEKVHALYCFCSRVYLSHKIEIKGLGGRI